MHRATSHYPLVSGKRPGGGLGGCAAQPAGSTRQEAPAAAAQFALPSWDERFGGKSWQRRGGGGLPLAAPAAAAAAPHES